MAALPVDARPGTGKPFSSRCECFFIVLRGAFSWAPLSFAGAGWSAAMAYRESDANTKERLVASTACGFIVDSLKGRDESLVPCRSMAWTQRASWEGKTIRLPACWRV